MNIYIGWEQLGSWFVFNLPLPNVHGNIWVLSCLLHCYFSCKPVAEQHLKIFLGVIMLLHCYLSSIWLFSCRCCTLVYNNCCIFPAVEVVKLLFLAHLQFSHMLLQIHIIYLSFKISFTSLTMLAPSSPPCLSHWSPPSLLPSVVLVANQYLDNTKKIFCGAILFFPPKTAPKNCHAIVLLFLQYLRFLDSVLVVKQQQINNIKNCMCFFFVLSLLLCLT